MSYSRFGQEDSDVYTYFSGYYECHHAGSLRATKLGGASFLGTTPAALINHLEQHREAGDTVPDSCLRRLYGEIGS